MSVYNDMANDAGYSYDTDENQQMAQMLEWEEGQKLQRDYARYLENTEYREILFRKFS